MVLLWVHWFVADEARCTFVGAGLVNVCSIGSRQVWQHQSPGYRNAEATILGLVASLLGCMKCAPVCEVDCERSTARSKGVLVRLSRSCLWKFLWMVETYFWL